MINYQIFVENSRKWLHEYIKNNHLNSIICGVSGGVDSCVSLALAYPVCKELNIPIIGRGIHTSTNKKEELNSASLVGEAFCTNYNTISLDESYCAVENWIVSNEGQITNLQKGNIKARLRMIYLRNLASIYEGIVLDNDNFTEWNLGFWTIAGDSPQDCNLGLHYLWKTEIYELANYLIKEYTSQNKLQQVEAIKTSISLTPTDGNGVSNSDCDQFGLENYEQVDDVLKTMYYRTDFDELIIESKDVIDKEYIRLIDSYNEQGVDKIMLLHQNTEFKRKSCPIMPAKEMLIYD